MTVHRLDRQQYRVDAEGASLQVRHRAPGQIRILAYRLRAQRFHVVSIDQGASYRIEVDGVAHQVHRDDGGVVRAPAPSVVVSIAVKPGDTVALGDPSGGAGGDEDGDADRRPIFRQDPEKS